MCVCVLVTQSCATLCDPINCSLPGSPVLGIFQARILEWVVIPFSSGSSQPSDLTCVSYIAGGFIISEPPEKPVCVCTCLNLKMTGVKEPDKQFTAAAAAKLLQSCPTLCNPTDCSPPGFSVPRILQVRILEWVTIPFSRGSS